MSCRCRRNKPPPCGFARCTFRGRCTDFAAYLNSKAQTSNRMHYDSITSQPSGLESQAIFFFYPLFIILPYFIKYTVFLAIHLRFNCIFICHCDLDYWNSKWKKHIRPCLCSYAVFNVNSHSVFTALAGCSESCNFRKTEVCTRASKAYVFVFLLIFQVFGSICNTEREFPNHSPFRLRH